MIKFGKFTMDKATVIRTLVLVVALLNQFLVAFGLSPFPFTAQEIEVGLSYVFTVVATLWSWWKNNDVTEEAQKGTEYMRKLKAKNKRKGNGN